VLSILDWHDRCKEEYARLRLGNSISERNPMNNLFLALYVKLQNLMSREEGQDLVEYALLVCLIALAAITGVNKVASAVTQVFSNISSSLA
jgi:pilus assembly protein Flp/PilA